MKIVRKSRSVKCFGELQPGDVFTYEESLYIKAADTELEFNIAYDLGKNKIISFKKGTAVEYVKNAKLVY